MHNMDMGLMGLLMLVGPLILLALMAGAIYLGVCAAQSRRQFGADDSSPRGVLEHRLAAGDVSVEEYYEREAALRNSTTAGPRRRWRPHLE